MILSTFVQIKKHTSEVAITHIAMDGFFFFFFFFLFSPSSRNAETLILKKHTNKQKQQQEQDPRRLSDRFLGGPSDQNIQRPGL
jgi:hypothetical protein